jgi:hypothetical protein
MKPEYLLSVIVVPWLWGFLSLAGSHKRKDQFIERLYYDHREIWEALGEPCGWKWSPPGRFCSPFSAFSFRWEWLGHDPDWLQRAPELREDFHELRKEYRNWNFRLMPIMFVSAIVFFVGVYLLDR